MIRDVNIESLPVVPRARPGELLGAWLLRLAEFYAVPLTQLWAHMGIAQEKQARCHWTRMPRLQHDILRRIADYVQRPIRSIALMQAGCIDTHRPAEFGYCRQCLAADTQYGRPIIWRRHWNNPFATTCPRHRHWLRPIATARLMAVKRYDHLVDLAYALLAEPLEDRHLDVEFDLLAGARRLEQALCGRTFDCFAEFESIGLNSARELCRVVNDLARILFPSQSVSHAYGNFTQRIRTALLAPDRILYGHLFTSRIPQLYLPHKLSLRQRLLGICGGILTRDPSWRIDICSLTDGEYSLLATATWRWPRATVKSLFLETPDAQHFDLMHRTNFTVAWQGIDMPASLSAFY